MSRSRISVWVCLFVFHLFVFDRPIAAQELPTLLQVDVENWVNYVNDVSDPSKLARLPGPVAASTPTNFYTFVTLADIIAINGNAAKGVMVLRSQNVLLNTNPTSGQAVADLIRQGYVQFSFEFLRADGSPFGSIFTIGLSRGSAAPGSPLGAAAGNNTIVGGTGAFIGVRGTLNSVQVTQRGASQAEDPSFRRINGGGQARFLLQVIPMFRPEILVTGNRPDILHSDSTPVTSERPARAGEKLIIFAENLGPTRPGVNPGEPFPNEPLAVVTSPVEVLVNGKASIPVNQVGVPGRVNNYLIEFQLPVGIATGTATIELSAAWIKGRAVRIPIS